MGRGQQSTQEHVADRFSSIFGDRRGANRGDEAPVPKELEIKGYRVFVSPPKEEGEPTLISMLSIVGLRDGEKIVKRHKLKVTGDECTFSPQLIMDLNGLGFSDEQQREVFLYLDAQKFSTLGW